MYPAKKNNLTMNVFHQQQQPAFISVRDDYFYIDQSRHSGLYVLIQKIQPIRKFFRDGKLICYSMDAKVSRTKKYCIFCDDKFRCQQKLRLSMILIDNLQPVILDLNRASFDSLQQFVDQCNDSFEGTPVSLKIIYDQEDRRSIEFISDDI